MKNLFLTLSACFLLFSFGCQENNITEPLATEVAQKDNFQQGTYLHDFIKLEGTLRDPSRPFNCCLQLRGQIEYEHRLVYTDPTNPFSPYFVNLKLSIEAELFERNSITDPIWHISEISEDKVDVQTEQIHYLTKYFKVQDRDDYMYLVCRFIVTGNNILLDGMWLKMTRLYTSENVSQ